MSNLRKKLSMLKKIAFQDLGVPSPVGETVQLMEDIPNAEIMDPRDTNTRNGVIIALYDKVYYGVNIDHYDFALEQFGNDVINKANAEGEIGWGYYMDNFCGTKAAFFETQRECDKFGPIIQQDDSSVMVYLLQGCSKGGYDGCGRAIRTAKKLYSNRFKNLRG